MGLTTPYTLKKNGMAERKNCIVVEMAISVLKAEDLPNNLWAKGVATVVYLLNISPTRVLPN